MFLSQFCLYLSLIGSINFCAKKWQHDVFSKREKQVVVITQTEHAMFLWFGHISTFSIYYICYVCILKDPSASSYKP